MLPFLQIRISLNQLFAKGGNIMKKALSLLAVMVLILGLFSASSMACPRQNCYATGFSYSCTGARSEYGSHGVEYPDGYVYKCNITVKSGNHSKLCSACGYKYGEVFKTCSEVHSDSHCFSKYNMCK